MQALSERLDALLAGATLRRADLLGFSSLKTYAPSPSDLKGHRLLHVTRRAKYLVWEFDDGNRIVLHLSQAGRLDVEEPPKKTKPRGAVARFVFGQGDAGLDGSGIGLLVREYGTQRKASWWVLAPGDDGPLAGLGPEPGTSEFAQFIRTSDSKRQLTTDLRDQHTVSGIGRGWGDDILQRAHLSPFVSLRSLTPEQREAPRHRGQRRHVRGARARAQAERAASPSRAWVAASMSTGASAIRARECGTKLERVSFESYEMAYCPSCQTGGKKLADRRLSRLLK